MLFYIKLLVLVSFLCSFENVSGARIAHLGNSGKTIARANIIGGSVSIPTRDDAQRQTECDLKKSLEQNIIDEFTRDPFALYNVESGDKIGRSVIKDRTCYNYYFGDKVEECSSDRIEREKRYEFTDDSNQNFYYYGEETGSGYRDQNGRYIQKCEVIGHAIYNWICYISIGDVINNRFENLEKELVSPVPCECGYQFYTYEEPVWFYGSDVGTNSYGRCKNINECQEKNKCSEIEFSSCVDIPGSYQCECSEGYVVSGTQFDTVFSPRTGDRCVPTLSIKQTNTDYSSFTVLYDGAQDFPSNVAVIRIEASRVNPFDNNVREEIVRKDTKSKEVTIREIRSGVEYTNMNPGTILFLEFVALTESGTEMPDIKSARMSSTSCNCPNSETEAPSLFSVKQSDGFIEFYFIDNSACADTFMFTRFTLDASGEKISKGTPLASTYSIFKNGIAGCGQQAISPGREARDDMKKLNLVVGKTYVYELAITSSVTAQTYTESVSTEYKIQWEASIDGEVTTNPELGSYPVENVFVKCTLLEANVTIQTITDDAGKYKCLFRDDETLNNYGYSFTNDAEYSVDITFQKTTPTSSGKLISHEFFCRGGVQDCTSEPLRLKLKHLELNKRAVTFDETAVPIKGKVTVANTGGCPLYQVQVCLTEYQRKSFRDTTVCTETNSLGEYTILASIDSVVGLRASYFEHDMVPSGNTIWVEKGIRIVDGNEYEGFDFEDTQLTNLTVEVGGGVCNIDLGKSTLELKIQGCISYAKQLEHEGFRNTFEVPAHALELEIKDIRKYNNEKRQGIVDYFEGEQKYINLTDTSQENGEDSVLFQYEGVAQILPTFYKPGSSNLLKVQQPPVDGVCNSGDLPYDGLQEVQDNPYKSYSFHTLDDKTLHLLSAEIKMYIDDDLQMCDQFPEGANFSITNQLGYSDGTRESDIEALETELEEEGFAQSVINILGRCNVGCSLPVLPENKSMAPIAANAQVEFDFLTGYPNFFEPYTRLLTIKSIGLYYPVEHICEVVVVGAKTLENFGSFAVPQSDPIMILRDPPGSRSYSYYKNVETKIELVSKRYQRSRKWNVDVMPGLVGKSADEIGLGWGTKIADIEASAKYVGKWEENTMKEYNEGVHSGKLSATWSYETSQDVWTAGKSSDTFVVPSLNIVFNEKRDLSWDVDACHVIDKTETEFDLESNSNKKLFSFVSHYFISKKEIPRLESLIDERLANDTSGFSQSQQNERNEEIRVLKNSLNQWKDIIQDHDDISMAAKNGDMTKLLGASTYVEQKVLDDLPEEVKNYFKGYTRPFAPNKLTSNVDNPEEYHSFKFDGGGNLLKYELSHEALTKESRRDGGDKDNSDFSSSNGFSVAYKAAVGGIASLGKPFALGAKVIANIKRAVNPLGGQSVNWGGTSFGRRRLENETNLGLDEDELNRRRELFQFGLDFLDVKVEHRLQLKQDSTSTGSAVGFVLGDENSGDYFDVNVFMDKQYGTFVFHTVAGESKCPVEPGTTPREVPFIKINESPSAPVLPNDKMIFKIFLQNQGTDLTGLDLYQDLRTNANGLSLTANSRSLAAPVPIERILGGEGYEALLTVSRGPVLYEYPPITLLFRSACEYRRNIGNGNLFALSDDESSLMEIQISNALDSEGKPIIKFERPCPEIVWSDSLESIRNAGNNFILNVDTYKDVFEIVIRNPNRNLYRLADVGRLETVKVWYRRLGVGEWTRAQDSTGNLIDMKTLDEDEFGYIQANWNVKSLFDGNYEVYVECNCERFFGAPKSFEKARTESLSLVQDTERPQLYGLPTPFEVITLNSPVTFVFSEPIQCLKPFTFKVRAIIEGSDTFYDEDNLVVLCEGRSIRVSFKNTFRWENVMGRALVVTIQDVLDLNNNPLKGTISHQIRFPSPASDDIVMQFNLRIQTDCLQVTKESNYTQILVTEVAQLLQLEVSRVAVIGVQCENTGLLLAKVTVSPATDTSEQGQRRRILNRNDDPSVLLDTLREINEVAGENSLLNNATLDTESIVITTKDAADKIQGSGSSIVYTPESPEMETLQSLKTNFELSSMNTQQSLDILNQRSEANEARLETILIGLSVTLVAIVFGGLVLIARIKQKSQTKYSLHTEKHDFQQRKVRKHTLNPIYEETL